jgi:hypothetical protein
MVARLGEGNKRTETAAIAMSEQRRGKNACHASDASIEPSRWDAIVPIRRLFIGPPNPENRSCIVGPPNELQTTRQVLLGKPIEHRQRATLEEIHGTGKAPPSRRLVHVIQRDGRRPDGRRGQDVEGVKGRGELGFDAPLLGQGIEILARRHPLPSQNARAHVLVQRQHHLVTEGHCQFNVVYSMSCFFS